MNTAVCVPVLSIKIIIQFSVLMYSGKSCTIAGPLSCFLYNQRIKLDGLWGLFHYKFQPFLSDWQIVLTLLLEWFSSGHLFHRHRHHKFFYSDTNWDFSSYSLFNPILFDTLRRNQCLDLRGYLPLMKAEFIIHAQISLKCHPFAPWIVSQIL